MAPMVIDHQHTCSNWIIIDPVNGLSPVRYQAISRTSVDVLLVEPFCSISAMFSPNICAFLAFLLDSLGIRCNLKDSRNLARFYSMPGWTLKVEHLKLPLQILLTCSIWPYYQWVKCLLSDWSVHVCDRSALVQGTSLAIAASGLALDPITGITRNRGCYPWQNDNNSLIIALLSFMLSLTGSVCLVNWIWMAIPWNY